jgi:hypothetical protein
VATSSTLTANSAAGVYAVTATATGASPPASFSLTNWAVAVLPPPATSAFAFYLSGQEAPNKGNGGYQDYYALAGAFSIDSTGNVIAGEQDYNDANGITSPPEGDAIRGGTLSVDTTTGQGTLTLITSNANVGVAGTETFGVQFVNSNHALMIQFDGSATSSGSLDLQTLPSTLTGGYAFTLSGVDPVYSTIAYAGVFSISGNSVTNGVIDVNDNGDVETGMTFAGTLSAPDSFGRGTITGLVSFGEQIAIAYYTVGPEVMRIIDKDRADSAIGTAFGQGAGVFTDASLGNSVFSIAGNPWSSAFGALGQFSTTESSLGLFSGVAEDNELGNGVLTPLASLISGTYSISSALGGNTYNGYGGFTIDAGDLGDVVDLGIYMTDPNLNLLDPNNTSSGLGGALLLDLDGSLAGGTGLVIPQTDTSTGDFLGNYAAGWQDLNDFGICGLCEFDVIAQGAMAAGGASSLTGMASDPFYTLTPAATSSGDTFTGTPLADSNHPGRYSMLSSNTPPNPLELAIGNASETFDAVLYQANGGELFWLEYDFDSVFSGVIERQSPFAGMPGVSKRAVKTASGRGSN